MMYSYFKRLLDIIFSLICIIVLSPIFIIAIFYIWWDGYTNFLYLQERVGYKNRKFPIYKFKTMDDNSELSYAGTITTSGDMRVTKSGKFLRISKVNELPQIFNVFLGDMSFVGPRPLPFSELSNLPEEVVLKVYSSQPGITGIGSLVFRDEEAVIGRELKKVSSDFYFQDVLPYKAQLEQWYTDNKSLLIDFKIILLTGLSLFFKNTSFTFKWFKSLPSKPDNILLS